MGWRSTHTGRRTGGFTLIELAIVMVIIALMASALLFAMFQVQQTAKQSRTEAQIARIHQVLMERYSSYKTRAVPVPALSLYARTNPAADVPYMRMLALRDLMRMEMPERKTDILADPAPLTPGYGQPPIPLASVRNPAPALLRSYRRRITAATGLSLPWQSPGADGQWGIAGVDDDGNGTTDDLSEFHAPGSDDVGWSYEHEGAECLYLVLSTLRDGDTSALDFFQKGEIGDTDNDGMLEILDGFGTPIYFLRWAPGYGPRPGVDLHWGVAGTDDNGDAPIDNLAEAGAPGSDDVPSPSFLHEVTFPDDFDPLFSDPQSRRETPFNPTPGFLLTPLIYSAGPDREFGIRSQHWVSGVPFFYAATRTQLPPVARPFANDPYTSLDNFHAQFGDVIDPEVSTDNVTNHNLEVD